MTVSPSDRRRQYTVDIVYPSAVMVGQTPHAMQWTAARAGAVPGPLTGPFDYCDIGCGAGGVPNLLAACYPQGRFLGVDINPEHIARGRSQAERAGLATRFIEASVSDLESFDLPQFDYIAAVGIYSWVPPELQRAILEFAARQLKPGGLLGLHYSSMPGAALRDPVSHYLRVLGEVQPGSSGERIRAAVEKTQTLARYSRFFEKHAPATDMLAHYARSSVGATAHDILNCQPHSFYFVEVMEAAGGYGFEYLGSANQLPDYPEVVLAREAYAALADLTADADIPLREATRDILMNTGQRFDVFRLPPEPQTSDPDDGIGSLGELYLQRAGTRSDIEARRQHAQASPIDITAPVYNAVLDFSERPEVTISQALADETLARFDKVDVTRAIEHLFVLGYLNVLMQPPVQVAHGPGTHYRLSSALNRQLMADTIASPRPHWLASPVLGSPIRVPAPSRLKLLAIVGGDLEEAWTRMKAAYPNLTGVHGGVLRDFAEFRDEVERGLPRFRQETLPQLINAGIVEVVASH